MAKRVSLNTRVRRPNRAIVFDLDDTLYPYRAFVRSGFRVVARQLADGTRSAREITSLLNRAQRRGHGRELQEVCRTLGFSPSRVPALVHVMREHTPVLRLPRTSTRVLASLKRTWKIGVLTNGTPAIQRRKVAALGLARLVDVIVCATECGDGRGKPSPVPFLTVCDRLRVTPDATVFVGDDAAADVGGAAALGIRAIHLTEHAPAARRCDRHCGGVHVTRMRAVPRVAGTLMKQRTKRATHHVA